MDVSTIIIFFVLGLMVVLMVLGMFRRKKERVALTEMLDALKVGDKVMTGSGLYGEIVEKFSKGDNEFVTIKTGSNDKFGYAVVSINAILYIFDENGEADLMGIKAKAQRDSEIKTESTAETEKVSQRPETKSTEKSVETKSTEKPNETKTETSKEVKVEGVKEKAKSENKTKNKK